MVCNILSFYFSYGTQASARAYINFVNVEDIVIFRDKFDGYIFIDSKGRFYKQNKQRGLFNN